MEVHGVLSYIIRGVDGKRYSFKVRTEIPAAGRVLLLTLKSDCERVRTQYILNQPRLSDYRSFSTRSRQCVHRMFWAVPPKWNVLPLQQ